MRKFSFSVNLNEGQLSKLKLISVAGSRSVGFLIRSAIDDFILKTLEPDSSDSNKTLKSSKNQ